MIVWVEPPAVFLVSLLGSRKMPTQLHTNRCRNYAPTHWHYMQFGRSIARSNSQPNRLFINGNTYATQYRLGLFVGGGMKIRYDMCVE